MIRTLKSIIHDTRDALQHANIRCTYYRVLFAGRPRRPGQVNHQTRARAIPQARNKYLVVEVQLPALNPKSN